MKNDLYTKIVLTVIAIFLVANFFKSSSTPVMAASSKYTTVPINSDGSINVRLLKGNTIDVNIESTDVNAFSKAEPIEIKENEPLEVKIVR